MCLIFSVYCEFLSFFACLFLLTRFIFHFLYVFLASVAEISHQVWLDVSDKTTKTIQQSRQRNAITSVMIKNRYSYFSFNILHMLIVIQLFRWQEEEEEEVQPNDDWDSLSFLYFIRRGQKSYFIWGEKWMVIFTVRILTDVLVGNILQGNTSGCLCVFFQIIFFFS